MVEEKSKWKKEVSAGGVVYKKENGQIFVLMINPKSRNYGPPENYWTWPKGKQDKEGEDLKQVALREVHEEGGVTGEIEAELGYVKYFRNWPGAEAVKFVHYYLMKYLDGNPENHDHEIADAQWVQLSEVESKLKQKHDKEIWIKAQKILTTSSD